MAREINLVPDVKNEMIRALKLRNLIFFICIVVASSSVAITIFFAIIAGGQQAVVNSKKGTIDNLSSKINSYGDLGHFLTVKDQLNNISSITENKQMLSRTFNILSAIIPTGADTIRISELTVDLSGEGDPTFTFDAQADAGSEPYIDYNVLDSFKKSMQYMRYDYGEYIDRYGNAIPSYCMIENGNDGASFYDTDTKSYYAYWLITGEGCDPTLDRSAAEDEEDALQDAEDASDDNSSSDSNNSNNANTNNTNNASDNTNNDAGDNDSGNTNDNSDKANAINDYKTEIYNGQTVVKIWRTPQFTTWYRKEKPQDDKDPYMDADGNISNVAHFESACINYSANETADGKINWTSTNETCLLVPEGSDGINIVDSSNGRGSSSELVLRFSAIITFNPEAFKFTNTHMIAIPPSGRRNVTDSYVQIQNMFTERATDCEEGDTECNSNSNSNSDSNSNSNADTKEDK